MFLDLLREELLRDSPNYFTDNDGYYSVGRKKPMKKVAINQLKRVFFSKPILSIVLGNDTLYKKVFLGSVFKYTKYLDSLEFFYSHLASEESKALFVKLVAFKLLGYVKVRLPLSTPGYWKGMKDMEKNKVDGEFLQVANSSMKLYLHDLNPIGFPIKVYINTSGAYTTFVDQQYVKVADNKNLGPAKGDVVLDLGGCYGDTALFFSYLVGEKGKVYSFEFIPGNVSVFKKNLSLNNSLAKNIEIVENPVWDTSGKKTYFKDAGSASRVSFEKFEGSEGETTTLSIDDFVKKYNIEKLDFIKSDIESAESYMLKGAVNTLKKFTPKLAISIYHNMNDFTSIIKQIDDLQLGYKFYLGHYTIYGSETILYAIKE